MKKIGYGIESIVYLIWILCVILIFKIVPDKPTAGTIAGVGFVFLPSFFLYSEFKIRNQTDYLHVAVLLMFLLCSALPIIFMRILNPGVDFNSIEYFGVSGRELHKYSNFFYLVMMGSALRKLTWNYLKNKSQ